MKHKISILFLLVLAAFIAVAQNNQLDVKQEGDNQEAVTEQIGTNNYGLIDQISLFDAGQYLWFRQEGNNNEGLIRQYHTGPPGSAMNIASLDQRGNDNRASLGFSSWGSEGNEMSVLQLGDNHWAHASQYGRYNYLGIFQDGFRNSGLIRQTGDYITARLLQVGNENDTWIFQDDNSYRSLADVVQLGDDNRIVIEQPWENNTALARQEGDRNRIFLRQNGDSYADMYQQGYRNEILGIAPFFKAESLFGSVLITSQIGDYNLIRAFQRGSVGELTQWGNRNLIVLEQPDWDNLARVFQLGDLNTVNILQEGSFNTAEVNQFEAGSGAEITRDNIASIRQEGNSNTAEVYQYEEEHIAEVSQIGNDNYSRLVQAYGQDYASVLQEGNGNVSFIGQPTDHLTAIVHQKGDLNNSAIDQDNGDFLIAEVTQLGNENRSELRQYGERFEATIHQEGNRNDSEVEQNAWNAWMYDDEPHVATIRQVGDDNRSFLEQILIGHDAWISQEGTENHSIALQRGFRQSARLLQIGTENFSYLEQEGADNTIDVWNQSGYSNYLDVRQSGNRNNALLYQNEYPSGIGDHRALVIQQGDDNDVDVTQDGLGAFAEVTQIGNDNRANVAQDWGGDYPTALIYQEGAENMASISQINLNWGQIRQVGSENVALIDQGERNHATIEQTGDGNYAWIDQFSRFSTSGFDLSTDNTAEVFQTGRYNWVDLLQIGTAHEASLLQQGDYNTATIRQEGEGQQFGIEQLGNNNNLTVTQKGW